MLAGTLELQMLADLARVQSDMDKVKSIVGDSMASVEKAIGLATKALIGFAGVASVNAFAGMIEGNIQAAAALGKLATQAGTTVEALSGLASVGKLSGTSADAIATAMNKMTKAVAGTSEDAKGAGAAIAALGMNFDDFNKMSADQRMVAVAQAMNKFEDGTGKSAAAMALLGKSGAELLPYLKDLAVAGELHAKITTAQAAAARDFENNLKRVQATSEAWKKELSLGMLPALDEASKAYLAVMNGAGGFRDEITKLSRDGSIAEWTRMAITALSYLMDAFEGTLRIARAIGVGMGAQWAAMAQVAQGNFSAAATVVKEAWSDIGDIFSAQSMGSKFRDRMEELKGVKAAAEATKTSLSDDFMRKAQKDATDKDLVAMQALIKATQDRIAVNQAQSQSMVPLTEGEKKYAELMAASTKGYSAAALAARDHEKALLQFEIAAEQVSAQRKADNDALAKYTAATQSNIIKLQEEANATNLTSIELKKITADRAIDKAASDAIFKTKTDELGITQQILAVTPDVAAKILLKADADKVETNALLDKIEAQKLNIQYQQEIAKLSEGNGLYFDAAAKAVAQLDLEAAKRRKAIDALHLESDARKQLLDDYDQWYQQGIDKIGAEKINAAWQSVDATAHTVFTDIFNGGQDAFSKLTNVLKSTLLDLLYQMTVKKWVFEIFADVTGAGSAGGAAISALSGTGSAGSSVSGLSSLYTMGSKGYSYVSSLFGGSGAGTVAGGAGEGLTSLTLGTGTAQGGAVEGLTSLQAGTGAGTGSMAGLSAIPIAGWIAMGMLASSSAYDQGFRANNTGGVGYTVSDGGATGPNGQISMIDKVLQGLGLDGKTAAILSGSALGQQAMYSVLGGYQVSPAGTFLSGTVGGDSANLQTRTDYTQDHRGPLGIGSYTTHNSDFSAADPGAVSYVNSAVQSVQASVKFFAAEIGLSSDAVNTYTKQIEVSLAGLDAKGQQDAVDKAITSFMDDMVTSIYGTQISSMALAGETSSTTLARVATEFLNVNQAVSLFGGNVLKVGIDGAKAADSLVQLMGGLTNFQAETADFAKNYLTTSQQRQASFGSIAGTLNSAGINVTAEQLGGMTRQQVADYVAQQTKIGGSLDLTTDTGRKAYAAVMSVEGSFASLTPTLEQAAQAADAARQANQAAYDSALANYGTSAEQKANAVAKIQASLSAGGVNLTADQISNATRADARALWQMYTDQGNKVAAQAVFDQQAAFAAITPAANAATAAIGGGGGGGGLSGAISSLASALQSATDSIFAEVSRINGLVAGPGTEGYAQAQANFAIATAQARAGDQTAAAALPGLSQALLTLAETNTSTLSQLNLIRAQTAASLSATGTLLAGTYGLTIPSYDVGTNLLTHDTIAKVHKGEAIVPAAYNPANGGSGGGSDHDAEIVAELRAMRAEMKDLRADTKRMKDILTNVTTNSAGGGAVTTVAA